MRIVNAHIRNCSSIDIVSLVSQKGKPYTKADLPSTLEIIIEDEDGTRAMIRVSPNAWIDNSGGTPEARCNFNGWVSEAPSTVSLAERLEQIESRPKNPTSKSVGDDVAKALETPA